MSLNNEIKKEILKDSLRSYGRLEQLNSINKDDIKSIHITFNVDIGDRLEIITIKPMITQHEITSTYEDIIETSKVMLRATCELLEE